MSLFFAKHQTSRLEIFRSGGPLPILVQNAPPDKRAFIHPIIAPDGMGELTENEPGHHLWQHGLYVGLNQVNGYGFWTEGLSGDPQDGTFHAQPLAAPEVGENSVSWSVATTYRAPDGGDLLQETQSWKLTWLSSRLQLDVDWSMSAATNLEFGQYPYGGLFLRMPWRHETRGDVLTSEGATTIGAAEGQRARWVAIAMPIPGRRGIAVPEKAGFAYLDHPQNPEFPNPWRVDDNLGIVPSRCIAGKWQLPQGATMLNRYRLIAFTGDIDAASIENDWHQFAAA